MLHHINDITADALVALQLGHAHQSLIDEGADSALTVDQIIKRNIVGAVMAVHNSAPVSMLASGHNFGDAVFWDETAEGCCCGHVLLPDDFMRLLSFKMSDWQQPCTTVAAAGSQEARALHSPWPGLRGNPERPACALAFYPEGKALEFASCLSTQATVDYGLYLPLPAFDNCGAIDICPRCYPAVVYRLAATVAAICGEQDRASALSALSDKF